MFQLKTHLQQLKCCLAFLVSLEKEEQIIVLKLKFKIRSKNFIKFKYQMRKTELELN